MDSFPGATPIKEHATTPPPTTPVVHAATTALVDPEIVAPSIDATSVPADDEASGVELVDFSKKDLEAVLPERPMSPTIGGTKFLEALDENKAVIASLAVVESEESTIPPNLGTVAETPSATKSSTGDSTVTTVIEHPESEVADYGVVSGEEPVTEGVKPKEEPETEGVKPKEEPATMAAVWKYFKS